MSPFLLRTRPHLTIRRTVRQRRGVNRSVFPASGLHSATTIYDIFLSFTIHVLSPRRARRRGTRNECYTAHAWTLFSRLHPGRCIHRATNPQIHHDADSRLVLFDPDPARGDSRHIHRCTGDDSIPKGKASRWKKVISSTDCDTSEFDGSFFLPHRMSTNRKNDRFECHLLCLPSKGRRCLRKGNVPVRGVGEAVIKIPEMSFWTVSSSDLRLGGRMDNETCPILDPPHRCVTYTRAKPMRLLGRGDGSVPQSLVPVTDVVAAGGSARSVR